MSENSAIEWTDATWSPVTGCTKVSPGCANCYIERTPPFRMQGRRFVNGTTGVRLHPERLDVPLRWRKPRRVFVCSLADLFHDDVPGHFIYDVFQAMHRAPQHTFQVLTKRPERLLTWYTDFREGFIGGRDRFDECWPLPNVWLGVSIENARFTWRADVLREIPAAVRFISAEPLLGSLFTGWQCRRCGGSGLVPPGSECQECVGTGTRNSLSRLAPLDLSGIDWVIVGGESGPRARPLEIEWVREIIAAARAGGAAPFVKQLGSVWARGEWAKHDPKGGDWDGWSPDLRVREFPAASARSVVA